MKENVQPPFFLIDLIEGEVEILRSANGVGGLIEPPEFKEGSYILYDSTGRLGKLGIDRWDVRVKEWSGTDNEQDLRHRLTQVLTTEGAPPSPDASLNQIVEQAAQVLDKRRKGSSIAALPAWLFLGAGALLGWAITRDYHDLQRIYGLALGLTGITTALILAGLALKKRG